uniref:Uncharacterized protein n=1 Tax=Rhizophora mucronata TaxID=61149 RepID=A0A2P2P3E1_RHIMU
MAYMLLKTKMTNEEHEKADGWK